MTNQEEIYQELVQIIKTTDRKDLCKEIEKRTNFYAKINYIEEAGSDVLSVLNKDSGKSELDGWFSNSDPFDKYIGFNLDDISLNDFYEKI